MTEQSEDEVRGPEALATAQEAVDLARDAQWRRLDTRMLLVHPVNELIRFLPLIIGIFVLGSGGQDGGPWHLIGVAIPIAIGILRFLSTRFRITAGQIELRRGLLGRSILRAPLDRVRTVELTASLIHRLLGLEKVEIGTGSASKGSEGRVVLDSLGAAEARRLRLELLHRAPEALVGSPAAATGSAPTEIPLLRLDPTWARYAPLTTSGLVIALGAVAAGSQFLGNLIARAANSSTLDEQVTRLPLAVIIVLGLVTLLVVTSVLAVSGYLLSNWDFTLTRDPVGRAFHVRRGLLTTRQTSIDLDRLRGVEIHEPLGLRLAGGGRAAAIVTGLNRRSEGGSPIVPPAPRAVVVAVGEAVLGEPGPLYADLVPHGPQARRRRLVRGTVPLTLVLVVLVTLAATAGLSWWFALAGLPLPVLGYALGRDRYARLGHALTPSYVVVRWGCLRGRRDALQRTGIIGWNLHQSFFQRRAGLVNLTATTAAGRQSYEILDVPEDAAVALATAAVPGLVEQFLA